MALVASAGRTRSSSRTVLLETVANTISEKPHARPTHASDVGAPDAPSNDQDSAQRAVGELQKQLRGRALRRWVRLATTVAVLVVVGLGVALWWQGNQPEPKPRFATRSVETRDIVEKVESTGRLKPLTEVQVGAQVSGRVVAVHVDFNSKVKKGDLLAEIDPQLFGAQVSQVGGQLRAAQANLERAIARRDAAKVTLDRVQRLSGEGIAAGAELDQAQSAFDVAVAEVGAAKANISGLRAQLSSARTTLEYTKIHSPIDGVVITRAIEPGQTVAASLSAPVLFVIAQDLRQMQVLADIDEADVGKLSEQMKASVQVDAFVGESFEGHVSQIRYSPNEVQGVVTYSAVVDVSNPEMKLRPGMTATVAITTRAAEQVAAAPNSALRFKPDNQEGADFGALKAGQGRLFQISGGEPGAETLSSKVVDIGITDGVWTQLQAEQFAAGTEVVTEQRDRESNRRKFLGIF